MKLLLILSFFFLGDSFSNESEPEKYIFYKVHSLNVENALELKKTFESEYHITIDYYCVPAGIFSVPKNTKLQVEKITSIIKTISHSNKVELLDTYTKNDADLACKQTRIK